MILDPHGNPIVSDAAPEPVVVDACPQCKAECPEGDTKTRRRSGGFGRNVRDVCVNCGFTFEVLTV